MYKLNIFKYLKLITVFTASVLASQGLFAKIGQSSPDSWIKPQQYNILDTIALEQVKDGMYYMLVDRQINTITRQAYNHYAYRVTSALGVQNNSEISIDYNPAYQKFHLHALKIIRSGKAINSIASSQIKEIQQERDLDEHIYDETKTVYIILKDVRPNDIIEYAYTIDGTNPIFKNKSYFTFTPHFDYKLLNFYFRIYKSKDSLHYKLFNEALPPKIKHESNIEEWIWDQKNNKAYEEEEYLPGWYNGDPFVEISSFATWAEVEKWGLEVFANSEKLDAKLIKEIEAIKSKYSADNDRLIAAVRFVQKQIRYLGIEIGINSHKPSSPNKVFLNRHGDCKDKSLLLCKMLQYMGIEAYPALINTWLSKTISNRLPSAMIFNHVVVKAYLNGVEQWFDPTIPDQEGNVQNYYFPNYVYSLVLDGKLNGLDKVPFVSESKIDINENLAVGDFTGKAELQVITTYYGKESDIIRSSFVGNSTKEIQKNYLKFYKTYYDSIAVEKTLDYTDDTIKNIFEVHESYQINDFWKKEKNTLTSSVYSYFIDEKLKFYNTIEGSRKSPLYLRYPLNINHSYKIVFPENWTIPPTQNEIKTDYLEFHSNARCEGKICYMEYSLKTLADYVPAEKCKAFLKDVKQITESHHGMTFTYNKQEGKGKFSLGLFSFFLIIIGFFTFISIRLFKRKKPVSNEEVFHPTIGGWMILPIIGLFLTPFASIYQLFNGNLFDSYSFHLYTSPGSSYYSFLWGPYWILDLLFQAAYIISPVLILILIFKYDRRAPLYVKWFYMGNLAFNLIILLLASGIYSIDKSLVSSMGRDFFRAIVGCAIWVPYFHFSMRVKETFIK